MKSPEIRLAATALPTADPGAGPYGGVPCVGSVTRVVNAPRGDRSGARSETPAKVVTGPNEEPALPAETPLSERDQRNQLRKTANQLARQRDVLKRTAATLIQESKE